MGVRLKVMTVGTVVALVGGYMFLDSIRERTRKSKVIVTGLWLDSPRKDQVQVTVSVGNRTSNRTHMTAPVMRTYMVNRGTRVQIRIRLLGDSGAKFVGCVISVDDVMAMEDPHTNAASGTEATCWAVG